MNCVSMNPQHKPEGPYLSFQSLASGRHATLEDDGHSAWLYLTRQTNNQIITSCLVYSRVELTEYFVAPFGKNGSPLLTKEFASAAAIQPIVSKDSLSLKFSADGNSVVVFLRNEPWTFINCDQTHGYSKSLSVAGPFGWPWNEQLYHDYFQDIHPD